MKQRAYFALVPAKAHSNRCNRNRTLYIQSARISKVQRDLRQ